MPRPGFYNDNEYRAYPFVYAPQYSGPALPNSAVVDCGVIMGLDSGFDPTIHKVWLASITRANNVVSFLLATDAPGAINKPIQFDRDEDDSEWATSPGQAAFPDAVNPLCSPTPVWEGFLVSGPLQELLSILAPGETITFPAGARVLEPARIQSLVKSYLRSLNIGNTQRTYALPPAECRDTEPGDSDNDIVINARCLSGDVRLKEGYNCRIRQVTGSNEIRVAAERNAGDTNTAELCEHGGELPLYQNEPFDDDTGFYSGGPSCKEMISTVNGVGGPGLTLMGGPGVRITTNADTHTITVALAQNNVLSNCNQ
jgi:hypothetical protein